MTLMLLQMKSIDTDDALKRFERKDELLDMMCQSGCDHPLEVHPFMINLRNQIIFIFADEILTRNFSKYNGV